MAWLHDAAVDQVFIHPRDQIDERTILFGSSVVVGAKAPVDEDIDDVSKGQEQLEVEALHQQREYVLRSYALEPLPGAVPVFVRGLLTPQLVVVLVLFRKQGPDP